MNTAEVLATIERQGLLLVQDKVVPSVTTLVAGEPIAGSWWGHPAAGAIFECLEALEEHPDVTFARLVQRKRTLVHRRLWPALVGVGAARADWQVKRLSEEARALLRAVDEAGEAGGYGAPAQSLQERLLVHARQLHTGSGHHETRLQLWSRWADEVGCDPPLDFAAGRAILDQHVADLSGVATPRLLPW